MIIESSDLINIFNIVLSGLLFYASIYLNKIKKIPDKKNIDNLKTMSIDIEQATVTYKKRMLIEAFVMTSIVFCMAFILWRDSNSDPLLIDVFFFTRSYIVFALIFLIIILKKYVDNRKLFNELLSYEEIMKIIPKKLYISISKQLDKK